MCVCVCVKDTSNNAGLGGHKIKTIAAQFNCSQHRWESSRVEAKASCNGECPGMSWSEVHEVMIWAEQFDDCVTICYSCKEAVWKLSRDFLANINFDPSWKMEANINSIKWKTETLTKGGAHRRHKWVADWAAHLVANKHTNRHTHAIHRGWEGDGEGEREK